MRWTSIVVAVMAIGCGGTKSGEKQPVPIEAAAVFAADQFGERIVVTIHTLPNAQVSATTVSRTVPITGTADAKGDAVLNVGIAPSEVNEIAVTVNANEVGAKPAHYPGVKEIKVVRAPYFALDVDGNGHCVMRTCDAKITALGHVEIRDLARVSSVTIDGAKATVTGGKVDHPTDLEAIADKATLAKLFERRDDRGTDGPATIAIEIVWDDGTKITGALPLSWRAARAAIAAWFATGAVKPRTAGSGKGVLDTGYASITPDVARLGDIGFVVSVSDVLREQECGTYVNDRGDKARFFMYLRDAKVRVSEASTGKAVGERTFLTPKTPCPKYVGGAMPEARYERGGEDRVWVESLTRRTDRQ